jgi:hypothetical protein
MNITVNQPREEPRRRSREKKGAKQTPQPPPPVPPTPTEIEPLETPDKGALDTETILELAIAHCVQQMASGKLPVKMSDLLKLIAARDKHRFSGHGPPIRVMWVDPEEEEKCQPTIKRRP